MNVSTNTVAPAPPAPAPTRTPFEPAPGITLDAGIPDGPIEQKWEKHKFEMALVNPANKRRYTIIVVGTGLAGGAAAATMAELGYNVKSFCYQDSPRRAHSIAAQGRSEEHTSELQSRQYLVCRLLLEKKK